MKIYVYETPGGGIRYYSQKNAGNIEGNQGVRFLGTKELHITPPPVKRTIKVRVWHNYFDTCDGAVVSGVGYRSESEARQVLSQFERTQKYLGTFASEVEVELDDDSKPAFLRKIMD
jgi:hypothetical protein